MHEQRKSLVLLLALVALRFALHLYAGGAYGFHRDELATIDDAKYLAAGYIAYPPVTPLIGRAALELFGPSLSGIRFFAALAQAIAMLLAGLMARELGASRFSQALAAAATGIAPVALMSGVLFQYVAFDYLWWVAIAYCMVRLLRSDDARWWTATGFFIGVGMLTKYTMGFLVAGVVAGVLFTPARRHLRSPWLWAGALLSIAVFSPNLVWQISHDFISLDFLESIHARDVRIGRTSGFFSDQFLSATNVFTVPLWIAGLAFFFTEPGRRYRVIGWMYLVPLALFIAMEGRGYYMAPAYPMLFAGGAVMLDRWMASLRPRAAAVLRPALVVLLVLAAVPTAIVALPLGEVHSPLWNIRDSANREYREELGWEELVAEVARIWATIPPAERSRTGIFAGNYGEAGAVNLYRHRYGLPEAISATNSYWLRGPGKPGPANLILLGSSLEDVDGLFDDCRVAGQLTNRFGVENEETRDHRDVIHCRGLKRPWEELWPKARNFG